MAETHTAASDIRGNALRYAEAAGREDLITVLDATYDPNQRPDLNLVDQILTGAANAIDSGRPWRLFSQTINPSDPATERIAQDAFLLLGADLSSLPDPQETTVGDITTLVQVFDVATGSVCYTQTEQTVNGELQISHNALFTPNAQVGSKTAF